MRKGQVLDFDALLAPVSEAAPTGVDLRDDASPQSVYYRLKDLRSAARAAERRADSGDEAGAAAEWRQVIDLSQQALTKQSKDLEIAAWLVEGLVRTHGFGGLRDGFELLDALIETFSDKLHSLHDEEGIATFVAPLAGLNGIEAEGTLIQPIRKVRMTTGDVGSFAAYHFAQGADLMKLTDPAARDRRIAAGVPTIEKFEEALRKSPKDFLRALLDNLRGSLAALDALSTRLTAAYGNDAPPTSRIKGTIEEVYDIVHPRTRDMFPPEPTAAEANGSGAPAAEGAHAANGAGFTPGAIASREEALRALSKISEFFKATEPHSTIAFTLDDVVRRARMTLPELLAELLPDAAARRTFLTSAGIRPPEGEG